MTPDFLNKIDARPRSETVTFRTEEGITVSGGALRPRPTTAGKPPSPYEALQPQPDPYDAGMLPLKKPEHLVKPLSVDEVAWKLDMDLGIKGAVKHDQDKPRWDLLPPELMEQTALVLGFGAKKYGNRNWELGMSWGRPFAAMMRHMWAWWRKENGGKDTETGYSHLAHAACCLAFLIAYEQRGIGEDDRP